MADSWAKIKLWIDACSSLHLMNSAVTSEQLGYNYVLIFLKFSIVRLLV